MRDEALDALLDQDVPGGVADREPSMRGTEIGGEDGRRPVVEAQVGRRSAGSPSRLAVLHEIAAGKQAVDS